MRSGKKQVLIKHPRIRIVSSVFLMLALDLGMCQNFQAVYIKFYLIRRLFIQMSENEIQPTDNETASEIKTGTFEAAASSKEMIKEKAKSVGVAPKAIKESEVEASKEEIPILPEEISYHAVEKDGEITAIWEMQGQKTLANY